MTKIIIWGAGELGWFVLKQISAYFKDWDCIGIVDSNQAVLCAGRGEFGFRTETPDILKQEQCDWLLICSARYQEIAETAENTYGIEKSRMMWADTIWPKGLQMNPGQKWERLIFRPFIIDSDEYRKILGQIVQGEGLLNELGIKYGTDKAQIMYETDGFRLTHDYLRHYQRCLDGIRNRKNIVCELGCGTGASLKMWKEYFCNSQIVGVDIDEGADSYKEDRIEIVIGNAVHEETIHTIRERYHMLDIIIDDASHAWGDMRISFEKLWDMLAHGGIYIIEDIYCGSMGSFPQYPPAQWDAQSIFDYVLDRARIMNFGRDWNPEYNRYHLEHLPEHIRKIERELDEIVIIHGALIIRKR